VFKVVRGVAAREPTPQAAEPGVHDLSASHLMAAEGQTTRVLLDPAALSGREHSHLDWFVPSPDGRHVACGISQGGSESGTLRVLDADSEDPMSDLQACGARTGLA
jgi:hypothetical protein